MIAWFDKIGRLNYSGQRFIHRMSVRTQLLNEASRSRMRERVQGGRGVVQNVASTVLSSIAAPFALADDALGHRVGVLVWTRRRLTDLAHGLEPTGAPGKQAAVSAWPETGERRKYDRRKFVRPGSGRRAADRPQEAKARAEQPLPQVPEAREPHKAMRMADARVQEAREETMARPRPAPAAPSRPAPKREPLAATMAEAVEAQHRPLAIKNYDDLNVHKIFAALRRVDRKDIPPLIAHERTNKNRKTVIEAMERKMTSA